MIILLKQSVPPAWPAADCNQSIARGQKNIVKRDGKV